MRGEDVVDVGTAQGFDRFSHGVGRKDVHGAQTRLIAHVAFDFAGATRDTARFVAAGVSFAREKSHFVVFAVDGGLAGDFKFQDSV